MRHVLLTIVQELLPICFAILYRIYSQSSCLGKRMTSLMGSIHLAYYLENTKLQI